MRRVVAFLVVGIAVGLAGVTAWQPPPGQLRLRPAEGRQPEFPPPNIREYKPKSTLVTPEHLVSRAKFAVIVNLSGGWGDRLRRGLDAIRQSKYPDRMVLFANVNFSGGVGPGFGVYHAFWKVYGIDLPDPVLRKMYHQNALKVTPGLPRGRFPAS